mmetsp:Transcript_18926/g.52065  ORF Transcript_18926/g.52065 Transcript_18926/m.52065 type:complete len:223 (+) Transcript_18926:1246-1914(+)
METLSGLRILGETALESKVVKEHDALGIFPAFALLLSILQIHRNQRSMPIIGNEDNVLSIRITSEGQFLGRNQSSLAEHGESQLVVLVILAPLRTIELLLGETPNLLQEQGMVHEDTIDALLESMEKSHGGHGVTERNLSSELGIPGVIVLIITRGNRHNTVSGLGHGSRQTVAHSAKTTGHRPWSNLRRDKHNLKFRPSSWLGLNGGTTTKGQTSLARGNG